MFRDDLYITPSSGMPVSLPLVHGFEGDDEVASAFDQGQIPTNDPNNLDDIFGSAPASPSIAPVSNSATSFVTDAPQSEVSDIPRLRSTHSTAGYRDGIASAKNATLQAGFDEGYSLGAVIGLRVGVILGSLEGIYSALLKSKSATGEEVERAKALLEKAKRELKTEEVFGREYWAEEGVWKFVVGKPGEEEEVTFRDVADAHPLIRRWEGIVTAEAQTYGLDLEVLERDNVVRLDDDDF